MHHQRDVHLADYQKLRPVQLTNGFLDFDTSHVPLRDESLEGPSSESHRAMNKSQGTYGRYHADDLFICAVNLSLTSVAGLLVLSTEISARTEEDPCLASS